MAVATPRSAWTSASSSSSSVAASSLRLVKRPVTLSDRDEDVRRHAVRQALPPVLRRGRTGLGRCRAELPASSIRLKDQPRQSRAAREGAFGIGPRRAEMGVTTGSGASGPSGRGEAQDRGAAVSRSRCGPGALVSPTTSCDAAAGFGLRASAVRPNRREKNPGLSGLGSAMGSRRLLYVRTLLAAPASIAEGS